MRLLPTTHSYIRLSDLSRKIESVFRQEFSVESYWVVAEISGHKFYAGQSRHYFELVEKIEGQHDPISKFRAVAWATGSESIRQFEEATRQTFTNGIQVLARVKIEFHAVHGLTLVLHEVDQFFTLGNLERQRMEILHKLVQENPGVIQKSGEEYLTKNKSIPLAAVLQSLAIIGSPNSEGFVDFLHTLENNRFGYTFNKDIYQSSVQGTFAEEELVQTLVKIFESGKNYDAVVIIRGGGAKTDFLVFDTYRVARAVARFPIPVITGIGHHKDVSISDLMVHTSTKTPTKAAEYIVSHNRAFEDEISVLQKSVVIRTQQAIAVAQQSVNSAHFLVAHKSRKILQKKSELLERNREVISTLTRKLLNTRTQDLMMLLRKTSTKPLLITAGKNAELSRLMDLVRSGSKWQISREGESLARYKKMVRMMHPDNVLKKGFAILSKKEKILHSDEQIGVGDLLEITTEHYKLETTVNKKTEKENGKAEL